MGRHARRPRARRAPPPPRMPFFPFSRRMAEAEAELLSASDFILSFALGSLVWFLILYFCAGVIFAFRGKHKSLWLTAPLLSSLLGVVLGFVEGAFVGTLLYLIYANSKIVSFSDGNGKLYLALASACVPLFHTAMAFVKHF
eukprot:gnl/Chilomastix_cuspidata/6221.p3 GENE.gnl/Chilomastix_cuspidata/6221~~gnl/Chilomastix_cuspidata/6221.p3  ORF type:complete len:142 (+),score=47.29 gnl/Chilomastix_cuspidata/6221:240-665(+)